MNYRKRINVVFTIIVAILIICYASTQIFGWFTTSVICYNFYALDLRHPCPPERDFDILDLMIDQSVFPSGWQVYDKPKLVISDSPMLGFPSVEQEVSTRFLLVPGSFKNVALQDIKRYFTRGQAQKYYRLTKDDWLQHNKQWKTPGDFTSPYHYADESLFWCAPFTGTNDGTIDCRSLARYQEYLVEFSVLKKKDNILSSDDIERILQKIDERMHLYLDKE